MANIPYRAVVQFLRKVSDDPTAGLSDGQLLERFRERGDEAAFVELLQRHGPLVLGVCDRVLHDAHDAEDAFQATFLVLVRRAHTILKEGSVASWLHGVAHRVAARLRSTNESRRRRDRQAAPPVAPDLLEDIVWRDLRAILDQEVLRLPARCREPFILCYLEGKTNDEAARLLGCPRGTVHSRLAHARELLRSALARRGLALSGGLLATMLPQPGGTTASAALTEATLRTAQLGREPGAAGGAAATRVVALAEGVFPTAVLGKVKAAAAVLLVAGALAAGLGAPAWSGSTTVEPSQTPPPAQARTDKPGPGAAADARKQLHNPDPQVRFKAALALTDQLDEEAIGVLIELLAELPPAQRKQAERVLQQVAEEWSPTPAIAGDDEISRRILRDAWAGWWRNADGKSLLAAFKKRTLSPEQTAKAAALIADLGDKVYATRQRAAADLVAFGLPVIPLLRQALPGADLEQARRLEQCLQEIVKKHEHDALPTVAARLLALRKPPGATEALLAYLPFTEDEVMRWEVAKALSSLAVRDAKADPALVKALQDPMPARRAVAGETLAAVADPDVRPEVRKLLADADLAVRLRVAVALTCAADKAAVPVLIDLVADLPADQVWQAEEILYALAGRGTPVPAAGDGAAARQKRRDAWRTWYATHGAKAVLTPRPLPPPLLGFTTVAAMSFPPDRTRSRVIEFDRQGKVRWQFQCHYPVDVHVLPGNRVLVSEYEAHRITERDMQGNILWQVTGIEGGSYNVQRLANGNTFAACRFRLMEFDADGKTVFEKNVGELVAGCKLADGQMVYLTKDAKCVRLDATGKEVKRFVSGHNNHSGCVLDPTSWGSLLVTRCTPRNEAAEFDLDGKLLCEGQGDHLAGISTMVRNGHRMTAVYDQSKVVESDRAGNVVWQCPVPGYNPFLARKR
jgi:RNA polymerase sigma-70 factor (ECF subfamily)